MKEWSPVTIGAIPGAGVVGTRSHSSSWTDDELLDEAETQLVLAHAVELIHRGAATRMRERRGSVSAIADALEMKPATLEAIEDGRDTSSLDFECFAWWLDDLETGRCA
jgi:hypothetical protein